MVRSVGQWYVPLANDLPIVLMTSSRVIERHTTTRHVVRVAARRRHPLPAESQRLILLVQVGWVAAGLIAVASFAEYTPLPATPDAQQIGTSSDQPKEQPDFPVLKATAVIPNSAILFANGSESLVARTVGHAEGTRTPNGTRTPAYFGHTDPGNGVWNLGSFSFQHCQESRYGCSTPEQADAFQLQRLQTQTEKLRQRAKFLGLNVTLEEELNAIDLTNQAPLAALSKPGYPDYLLKAKKDGLSRQDAVLEARVWSYWNPEKNHWDAPGLGNTEASIRHDQKRRMLAIARALEIYQQQPIAQSSSQQRQNWLNANRAKENPYSYATEQTQYLWWDAGYWDARLNRDRQVPEGYDPAYDQGFQHGANQS